MVYLESLAGSVTAPLTHEVDERAARRTLRAQISRLERDLAARCSPPTRTCPPAAPACRPAARACSGSASSSGSATTSPTASPRRARTRSARASARPSGGC